ncbi:MAG: FAD binding domain-containing protein [Candidatus Sumerlaeaceae bacterium]
MFYQPRTIEEALSLKRQLGPDAAFLAGGTDVIVLMNHGRLVAKATIDLTHVTGFDRLQVSGVDGQGSSVTLDGGVTFAQLARLPVKCLAEASLGVGGPQIRNRGTIAGNVATASPAGDGSTALLALDAVLELRNSDTSRKVPLRDFFLDYRKTALAPDEMITAVEFPGKWRTAWQKLGKRGAMNISMVCCAVGVSPEGMFRVAFGSVGPYPLRAPNTEEFLSAKLEEQNGRGSALADSQTLVLLSETVIAEAERMASHEVRPIDDFRASAAYRRAMSGALLKKCLRDLGGKPEPVKFSG